MMTINFQANIFGFDELLLKLWVIIPFQTVIIFFLTMAMTVIVIIYVIR